MRASAPQREEVLSISEPDRQHPTYRAGESFTLNVSPSSVCTNALMKRKRSRSAKVLAPRRGKIRGLPCILLVTMTNCHLSEHISNILDPMVAQAQHGFE